MNSMKLKDFKPDDSEFDPQQDGLENTEPSLDGNVYREEINTIKIDKLSNRVTIISVIIPVMIGVIIVFAYLDMKERVVDVDQTKQSQVDKISHQLEEKLNALDVKIAKNRFELENSLPALEKKDLAIEGQMAKLSASKADTKTTENKISQLSNKIGDNSKQNKSNRQAIDKLNKDTLASIKTTQTQFNETAVKFKEEITLFKEEFDARLLELSEYEQQIGLIRKDISLLDKKMNKLEQVALNKSDLEQVTETLQGDIQKLKVYHNEQIKKLNTDLTNLYQKLSELETSLKKQIQKLAEKSKKAAVPPPTVKKQVPSNSEKQPDQPNSITKKPLAQ